MLRAMASWDKHLRERVLHNHEGWSGSLPADVKLQDMQSVIQSTTGIVLDSAPARLTPDICARCYGCGTSALWHKGTPQAITAVLACSLKLSTECNMEDTASTTSCFEQALLLLCMVGVLKLREIVMLKRVVTGVLLLRPSARRLKMWRKGVHGL